MKILVTGATGFFGKYIINELTEHNYNIIAFGRNEEIGKNLEKENKKVVFFKGDFTDKEKLNEAAKNVSGIVHAGGLSTVWGKWQDFYNINVKGTENILNICRENNIRKLVFISSPSIYAGPEDQLNIKEEEAPDENNLNFYIKSKIEAERRIKEYSDVPSVILRPRGLFGIGDTSVIPRLLRLNGTTGIPVFGDGRQYVDVTCVENAALAVRLALERPNAAGQVYNITNDEPMMFKDILGLFFKETGIKGKFVKRNYFSALFFTNLIEKFYLLTGTDKEPPFTKYTLYLMKYSQTLCIEKAKKELEYKPKITVSEGVKKYVEYNKRN
ncbi:MAG: NAD(P)-dependent oxidoreductase [Leptotrichiaceae bacterium]|nr:NAD(P)-dependent oxidoreductase [Leptotrichiaceae bacterium]